jgi:diguanylate cyclase (GGDEF)-like protein/PAS domain S-box-containing protein
MSDPFHYLEQELYDLVASDPKIFDFFRQGSLDGVWYWDLQHVEHEWMSPEFWHLFGYDPGEMEHRASEWQSMIYKEDLDKALENFNAHCADPDHPYDQVVRYRHRDGSTVWVRCRGIAIRDKSGRPVRMLGAHNDITELKRSEQVLEEQKERYLSLFQGLPVPAYTWRRQGNDFVFTGYNRAALRITEGRIVGREGALLSEFFSENPEIRHDIAACFAQETTLRKIMRHTLQTTGTVRDLDVSYVFVPPDTVMVLTEDVSQRMQAEDEVRQLATAVEQSSSCVVITDPEGNIEYVNPTFTRMYGYAPEEVQGRNPRVLKSGNLSQEEYRHLWETITSGESWSGEFCNVGKTGKRYWVKASVSPVTDPQGSIRHFVGVQEDITELKKTQARLLELATTDGLTGLANRRHFLDRCEEENSRCCRYGSCVALLMIDVDHFKRVNDTLGHDSGDAVLKQLAGIMEESLRTADIAGRLGGEEFGALLPETGPAQALQVAERLRAAVEQADIDTPSGRTAITLSIGVGAPSKGCATVEEMLKKADLAMYEAKRSGRNRVVWEGEPA